ncbi:hypothetical protein GWE18_07995 [Bradyrhizobium sp. CSA112]|uniref:O-antigen ligase family protein n=1 Tax=Bradyrhizobium sp. CSA112 TaxID=2699170 RepID=UPI0023AF9A11|nr:O-antigen ligase family protein [Bradyrhizobium sp. CSA112]MDE5452809.1 hypothetical protein [Bradyrhizobium sp. CSA112]
MSTANVNATVAGRSHTFAAWLFFLGVILPGNMSFFLGDTKFNPERVAIALLLIPALILLLRKGRCLVAADLFACLASIWMLATSTSLQESLSSAAAMTLEFFGGYIVTRAFFFGHPAIAEFVRVLKVAVAIIVAVAMLDHMSGKLIVNDALGLGGEPEYRSGLMRAASVFPHPILYGAFCAVSGAIFLYSEARPLSKIGWVGLCFLGCLLAMSSAPFLAFLIAIFVYCYDRLMKSYPWRWKAFAAAIASALGFIFLTTNKPISWIVAHLTLDPSTGYFRVATWDRAFYNIGLSPWSGYGFGEIRKDSDEFFDNASVDSAWLVLALRFGIPIVVFLFLANVASFFIGFGKRTTGRTADPYMDNMRTAFTLAVVILMLAGLTTHSWNTMWMLWGAVIGVRASLYEQFLETRGLREVRSRQNHSVAFHFPAT